MILKGEHVTIHISRTGEDVHIQVLVIDDGNFVYTTLHEISVDELLDGINMERIRKGEEHAPAPGDNHGGKAVEST